MCVIQVITWIHVKSFEKSQIAIIFTLCIIACLEFADFCEFIGTNENNSVDNIFCAGKFFKGTEISELHLV